MSDSQLHGKTFENRIKASSRFPGAATDATGHTAAFDIAARFDTSANLPTSIKTSCNTRIGLADARRFWALIDSFRMLVGLYRQTAHTKAFHTIHEFIIGPAELAMLRGGVTSAEVGALHEGISLEKFDRDDYRAARKWAAEATRTVRSRSLVRLDRKIDSKGQRRFQCSVDIEALVRACPGDRQMVYTKDFGDIALPLRLPSTSREFD